MNDSIFIDPNAKNGGGPDEFRMPGNMWASWNLPIEQIPEGLRDKVLASRKRAEERAPTKTMANPATQPAPGAFEFNRFYSGDPLASISIMPRGFAHLLIVDPPAWNPVWTPHYVRDWGKEKTVEEHLGRLTSLCFECSRIAREHSTLVVLAPEGPFKLKKYGWKQARHETISPLRQLYVFTKGRQDTEFNVSIDNDHIGDVTEMVKLEPQSCVYIAFATDKDASALRAKNLFFSGGLYGHRSADGL